MVGVRGVEPRTLRLSSACSNQLSYTPNPKCGIRSVECRMKTAANYAFCTMHLAFCTNLVELRRFELLTYSLQSYRSTN